MGLKPRHGDPIRELLGCLLSLAEQVGLNVIMSNILPVELPRRVACVAKGSIIVSELELSFLLALSRRHNLLVLLV